MKNNQSDIPPAACFHFDPKKRYRQHCSIPSAQPLDLLVLRSLRLDDLLEDIKKIKRNRTNGEQEVVFKVTKKESLKEEKKEENTNTEI